MEGYICPAAAAAAAAVAVLPLLSVCGGLVSLPRCCQQHRLKRRPPMADEAEEVKQRCLSVCLFVCLSVWPLRVSANPLSWRLYVCLAATLRVYGLRVCASRSSTRSGKGGH